MNNLDFSKYENLEVNKRPEKGTPRNQREEVIVEFLNILNEDRTREKNIFRYREWLAKNKLRHTKENINKFARSKDCYKPLTYAVVATLLKHFDTSGKFILLRQCKEARVFGACFWSKIKK